MYYLIKDLDSWNEKIHVKRSKVVAFVSDGLMGEERRKFDRMFDQFSSAFYKKVLFLYVNVDRDNLREVFSQVSGELDIFPLVAIYDPDGNLIKKEINPPPKRFRDLIKLAVMSGGGRQPFYIVADKSHWDEMLRKPKPKAAAFVSDGFMGKEREAFDRMFREFAKAHRDEIIFLYVVCDRDDLWDVYESVKPGGLRMVPMVATIDVAGNVVETYVNPSPQRFREMLKKIVELTLPEDTGDAEDVVIGEVDDGEIEKEEQND